MYGNVCQSVSRLSMGHSMSSGLVADMSSVPISAGQSRFRPKCPDVPPVGTTKSANSESVRARSLVKSDQMTQNDPLHNAFLSGSITNQTCLSVINSVMNRPRISVNLFFFISLLPFPSSFDP